MMTKELQALANRLAGATVSGPAGGRVPLFPDPVRKRWLAIGREPRNGRNRHSMSGSTIMRSLRRNCLSGFRRVAVRERRK